MATVKSSRKRLNDPRSVLNSPLVVCCVGLFLGFLLGFLVPDVGSDLVSADYYVCTYTQGSPEIYNIKGFFCFKENLSFGEDPCPLDNITEYKGRITTSKQEIERINKQGTKNYSFSFSQ